MLVTQTPEWLAITPNDLLKIATSFVLYQAITAKFDIPPQINIKSTQNSKEIFSQATPQK